VEKNQYELWKVKIGDVSLWGTLLEVNPKQKNAWDFLLGGV